MFGRKRTDPVDTPAVEQGEADQLGDDHAFDDPRADGPFDYEEVDLKQGQANRLDLGTLILTPWPGMGLQLQVSESDQLVQAVTAIWKNSGLEISLLAAPAAGGLAADLREDLIDETEQSEGSAEPAPGPFGTEVRRVIPKEGPKGEQLFQVSRTWFAEGPRWVLRATLLGEAAMAEPESATAAPFVEFFRNLVVRRGDQALVPGALIPMELPPNPAG